jgi:hypothetical protein
MVRTGRVIRADVAVAGVEDVAAPAGLVLPAHRTSPRLRAPWGPDRGRTLRPASTFLLSAVERSEAGGKAATSDHGKITADEGTARKPLHGMQR